MQDNKKQRKYDLAYLKMAYEWSKLSHCKRKNVGALIVKDNMIISDGYNGCPSGFENNCEDSEGETHTHTHTHKPNGMYYMPKPMQS